MLWPGCFDHPGGGLPLPSQHPDELPVDVGRMLWGFRVENVQSGSEEEQLFGAGWRRYKCLEGCPLLCQRLL